MAWNRLKIWKFALMKMYEMSMNNSYFTALYIPVWCTVKRQKKSFHVSKHCLEEYKSIDRNRRITFWIEKIMTSSDSEAALIKKQIIYPGSKYIPLADGTKVRIDCQFGESCCPTYICM